MDLPKFTCDLYMADRIEEVAKNRVCVYMHVGALAMILEIFKFPYRVLLGHDGFDLQFELSRQFSIRPRRPPRVTASSQPGLYDLPG